jgi:energy-coupling factor transport system substrate-specific component
LVLGLGFGAVMNLWFWPFVTGGQQSALYWQPGLSVWESLRRYALFYAVTSAWWDVGRAVGNAVLILLLGWPILRVLRRFRAKFRFEVTG